jgi:hypothetical protein
MSPSLRSLYLAVRTVLLTLAPVLSASLVTFSPGLAEAGQSAWAPMCDLSAATVVAPLVAPPVDGGEITVCPDGSVREDFEQMLLRQGGEPGGEPDPGIHLEPPPARVLPATAFRTPYFARASVLLAWPELHVGPTSAFARLPDRPPCA